MKQMFENNITTSDNPYSSWKAAIMWSLSFKGTSGIAQTSGRMLVFPYFNYAQCNTTLSRWGIKYYTDVLRHGIKQPLPAELQKKMRTQGGELH